MVKEPKRPRQPEQPKQPIQSTAREIKIMGIDPGLTKTGIGVLRINLEKDCEMGLCQFVLSNYLLLLNLQNLSKDLIHSNFDSLASLSELNALSLSNFISKKKKKTKKEMNMDDRLLSFIRQSSFLCKIDLSKISARQMIEAVKAPSIEFMKFKDKGLQEEDAKEDGLQEQDTEKQDVKEKDAKGSQAFLDKFLDDKEYFEIYLSLYQKYFGDLPIFANDASCLFNQLPTKKKKKNKNEKNVQKKAQVDEVFHEIYDDFAKNTEESLEKNAEITEKIETTESTELMEKPERLERKIINFLPSFVDQETVYTKTSMPTHLRLKIIYDRIEQMVNKHSPSHMILEEVFVNSSNPMSALKLGGARGVISLIAANYNMPLIEIFAGKIKQRITFSWHEDKSSLKTIIYQIFQQNFQCSLDASDAIAGAICGILEMQIENADMQTKRTDMLIENEGLQTERAKLNKPQSKEAIGKNNQREKSQSKDLQIKSSQDKKSHKQ